MIFKSVICDKCGTNTPKEKFNQWHNMNLVAHDKAKNTHPASFHLCSICFYALLYTFLGDNISAEHRNYLDVKIFSDLDIGKDAK